MGRLIFLLIYLFYFYFCLFVFFFFFFFGLKAMDSPQRAETDILLNEVSVDLRSLNTPLLGKALTSPTKDIEGVLFKRGEVNKSWKQRVFVIDSACRCLYYFKDKKPQELAQGFIPLWDTKTEIEPTTSPRVGARGARSQLKIMCPFRRTFFLGFQDDAARDMFRAAADRLRVAGRAQDARGVNSWWRNNVSKKGDDRCEWGRFSAALSRSLKVHLSLEAEAAFCYVLHSLHRTDIKEIPSLETVTLASLVEFSFLFGSLVDGLEKLDGVFLALTACSMVYAEKMVMSANPGTFVLYVASRPTTEALAVLGLVFVNARGKPVHKHVFRDPVSKRFYTDINEPAFARLDHLVATAIGLDQTFARQTRLKLDEQERIKQMICFQQKMMLERAMSNNLFEAGSGQSPRLGQSPRMGRDALPARTSGVTKSSAAPVFDEIEKLLMEGESSSEREEDVNKTLEALEEEKYDVSEMMTRNLYCVTCGVELTGGQRKFPACDHCGTYLVEKMKDPQWQMNDLEQEHNTAELEGFAIHFHHNETLSAEDVVVVRNILQNFCCCFQMLVFFFF
jgi:hypothetical protein